MSFEEEPHQCHLCGTYVKDGYEYDVDAFDEEGNRKRHWLSDCRPDLVEHEVGELCTWPIIPDMGDEWNKEHGRPSCYAYNSPVDGITYDHIYFMTDGPT